MRLDRSPYRLLSDPDDVRVAGGVAQRLGCYAARSRAPSTRAIEQAQIVTEIRRAQARHRGCYGRRRMTTEVRETLGRAVNEKQIGRLMRAHDLGSRKRRRFRVVTTDSKHAHPVAPNVLQRDFEATAPNQKWLADLTYVPTDEGWLYLALVQDLFSRKLVGWAMSETMPQELTLTALAVALGWRDPAPGLVHHSDRGSQYAAGDYRKILRARGITVSMSRKGDCWDKRADGIGQWHGEGRVCARSALPDPCRGAAGAGRVHRLLQHGTAPLFVGQCFAGRLRAALASSRVARTKARSSIAVSSTALSTAGRFPVRRKRPTGRPWITLLASWRPPNGYRLT